MTHRIPLSGDEGMDTGYRTLAKRDHPGGLEVPQMRQNHQLGCACSQMNAARSSLTGFESFLFGGCGGSTKKNLDSFARCTCVHAIIRYVGDTWYRIPRFGGRMWKLCFQITSVRQCEGLFSPFKYVLQSSVYRTELEASSKFQRFRARFEFGAIDRRL